MKNHYFLLHGPGQLHDAIGKSQLDKPEGFLKARRRNAAHFVSLFEEDERFIIQKETGESSWFSFTMRVNPESVILRASVLRKLKAAGIEHRIITAVNILRRRPAAGKFVFMKPVTALIERPLGPQSF